MDENELRQRKKLQLARLNANVLKKQVEDNVKTVVNIQEVKTSSGIPIAERIVIRDIISSGIKNNITNTSKADSKTSRIGLIEDKKVSSFLPRSTMRTDTRPSNKKENIIPQTHLIANPKVISGGKTSQNFETKYVDDNLLNEIKDDIHTLSFPTSTYLSSNYYPLASSKIFENAPIDPTGRLYDLSNLPLLCSSSYNDEVVFGCADHALYAINISDKSKRIKKLYTKQHGHAEWVSSVSHLLDGRVISAGMDGKLCLWDLDKSKCTDLSGHDASISKVLTDTRYNTAVSCGYDKNICLWKFDNAKTNTKSSSSVAKRGVKLNITPIEKLSAHNDAIVEIAYSFSNLLSASRDGGLVLWDLGENAPLNRIKAHQGCITALESIKSSTLFVTAGADGFVKIWDSRNHGSAAGSSVLSTKVPTHASKDGSKGSAIACITQVSNSRGSSECSYVVSCGVDGKVVLLDARQSYRIVETYNHARNGCYAVTSVGESCVIISDGSGMIYCYDIVSNELKYGIGASEKGAVRIINNPHNSNLLVTGNEDGKCLIFEY